LDGGEITIIKTLGTSGSPMHGKLFLSRIGDVSEAEFIDSLDGLISLGYVVSSKVNVRKLEDVERAFFRVNAAYSRELRDAMFPGRRREDDRSRRQRRR
jgi:hypothetical protein